MVRLLIAFCLLAPALSIAQVSDAPQHEKDFTLQQQYWLMKSKAETYQEYKVIKEYVMDGVWKIMMDSLKGQKMLVAQGRQTISQLEADLQTARRTLAQEREAATAVTYDSVHISFLGINIKKNVFLVAVAVMLSLLFIIGSGMATKIKLLRITAKEKTVIADLITREFDEFKHKAMDKQIKLARELQNERNKLTDLKQTLQAK